MFLFFLLNFIFIIPDNDIFLGHSEISPLHLFSNLLTLILFLYAARLQIPDTNRECGISSSKLPSLEQQLPMLSSAVFLPPEATSSP